MKKENKLEESKQVSVSVASEKAEALGGTLIAFFAALMAIAGLVNSNIEDDKLEAQTNQSSYFSWYQSKSVKQSLQESHLSMLETLIQSNVLKKDSSTNAQILNTKNDIKRYKMEKKEIMQGSSTLPKSEWVQDLDGKMGQIIGVKEWESKVKIYENSTSKFDIAMLFFQVSLVLGAVCIVIYDNPRLQKIFISLMIFTGLLGIFYSIYFQPYTKKSVSNKKSTINF